MPQDSRRSIGYRSFVTCDDPKGVVDCGAIRRSKTSSRKMEQSIERRSIIKQSNKSSARTTEREELVMRRTAEEFGGPTSFQLLEVSRGVQKLNKMIETWSKGLTFEGQCKDNIAKDLLKGALDLEESLAMLGKLQASTKYVARLKQKQENSEGAQGDEMGFGKRKSDLFEDRDRFLGLKKPQLLGDGSSENDVEELRKVIRESFARQNLLPSPVYGGEDYFHRRNTDSVSSMPSTSSSHSSTVRSDSLDFTNSSLPSATSWEKAKSPSVVAKLMGLEEFPFKLAKSPPRKMLEPHNSSLQERPVFNGVIPKMKKPENKVQNIDMAQSTLREIVDTMQLKRLLRSNISRKMKPLSQLFDECDSEECPVIDVPPIVLMMPISLPYSEAKENLSKRDGVSNPQSMLKMVKLKEEHASKPMDPTGGAQNCENLNTMEEEEDTSVTRPTQRGGEKKFKEDDRKSTKEKILGKSLKKTKRPAPASEQPLKKEAIGQRPSENEKEMKKEVSKSRSSPQSQDTTKVTSAKLVNPETEVNRKKNRSPQHGTNLKTKSKPVTHALPCNQDDLKRVQTQRTKQKPAREKKELRPSKMNDRECETNSVQIEAIFSHVDQQIMLQNENASDLEAGEDFSNGQNNSTLPTLQYERDAGSAAKACDHISQSEHEESYKRRCYVKAILLNDPSFVAHAQELFESAQCPTVLEGYEKSYSGSADERLYLDFARELIDHKSLQACQKSYFLLTTLQGTSRICISMDKLLEEICDGIDDLNDCCKFASAKLSVDGLYAVLKRDIWSKRMANGTWESGWRNGYSLHDAEQVVNDIENVLFSWLIEEAVEELSNLHCE
ncbi:uncharacterized protein LOC115740542 isoform X2 [Rhodamnia argentea]|uniref:Uncharacterized protein LOC115740542 isoform X2 n=1 Tax=Rhodamnia argentea TaxID=178133 RepID=A0A8B8P7K4_9MYRT|nr:uncharacterized protein LOC115740542 isoform X2 [Rhodamnia argentea]